jgi:hypothetical protein
MARLLLGLVVVVVVATIYAVIDCAMLAHDRVRGLPKPAWLVIILVLPVVGVVLWFLIGRGRQAQTRTRQLPPDDNPEFFGRSSASAADPDQDERIRRLEEELAALDSEGPADGSPSGSTTTRPGATSADTADPADPASDSDSDSKSAADPGDEPTGTDDGTAKRGKSDDEPGAGRADV